MTATTTPTTSVDSRRGHPTLAALRHSARAPGTLLTAVASRWNDFVDAGQLGSSAETVTSRHTGARI